MLDSYSIIPLPVIYAIGVIILIAIVWSLLQEFANADLETRKKLMIVYASLMVGSIVLVWGLSYFKVSEKLFPSFYEHEEIREQLNNPNLWDQNFKLEDWQKPFD